ncbi:MAG: hypothetical protein KDM91_14260, partial [Verrucomicrobiae bacterium]|nr:hypothetical protein [Verrucomicrobiae bacterium]
TSGGDPKSPLLSPEKIEWIKNPYVQLGGASLLLILVLVFALGDKSPPGDSGDDTPPSASTPGSKPETSSASGSDPAPPSLPKLENPTALPRVSPPPAIAEGLTMHYAASDWVLGSDFKTPAKSGERVKAWGNIAAGIEKDHLLIVDRNAQDLGPIFTLLDPADYPELKAKTPALEFSRGGSKLNVSGGGQDWKPRLEKTTAMTFLAVLRTTSPRGNIFRFERKSGSAGGSWAFSFEIGSKGYYTTLNKGSLQPRCETPLGNTRKNFLIFTTVWDGGQVHQRHYARLPNGPRLYGPIEDAPFKPIEPSRYSLGNSPNPDPRASYTEGHFLEWMVYDRALPEAEIETLEKQLSEKYFTPGFDQKPNVPFYNSEGKLPDPRNPADAKPSTPAPPVTDGLSARYAAGDFTLGNDCVTPVSPGKGCVVVWGNAAADASGDHLMAWGSGREGRAPMMISARPNQYPELASPKDAVRFMTGSELVSRGGQFRGQGNDDGFTAFIVFNGEPESGPALRLSTDTIEDFATIGPVKDGFEAVMRDGPDDRQSVKCFGQPGAFAIASLTWRGDQRTQEFFVRQKDGATVTSKRGNAPAAPRDLSRYQISRVPDPKYKDLEGFYNGRVLEFLIYTRALSDDERKAVEDHLHGQYFAK